MKASAKYNARSFGGLFYLLCGEVGTLDWLATLQQLLDLINEVAQKAGKTLSASDSASTPAMEWIAALPS